jgi:hypothetical protein
MDCFAPYFFSQLSQHTFQVFLNQVHVQYESSLHQVLSAALNS